MEVQPTPNYVSMLVLLLVVVALIFAASKLSGRALAGLLGIGGILILSYLMVGFSVQRVEVQSVEQQTGVDSVSHQQAEDFPADALQPSTEQLWDQIYSNRIQLSQEDSTSTSVLVAEVQGEAEFDQQQTRPDWVDKPPKRVGNVYRVVVSSDPYRTVEECHRALEPQLRDIVQRRHALRTPDRNHASLEQIGLGLDFIFRHICRDDWVEQTKASFGEMQRVHVLMEFDEAIDRQLDEMYRQYERRFRIAEVGGITGLVLGALALLYGMLKVDTWTRGYYTKRLFFGVPAVIIMILLSVIWA